MKLIILTLLLTLSGCAELQALKSAIGSYGANGSDEVLDSAIRVICKVSPIGAHKRRFKTDEEIAAVKVVCGEI
jgi:hypothetical protein